MRGQTSGAGAASSGVHWRDLLPHHASAGRCIWPIPELFDGRLLTEIRVNCSSLNPKSTLLVTQEAEGLVKPLGLPFDWHLPPRSSTKGSHPPVSLPVIGALHPEL